MRVCRISGVGGRALSANILAIPREYGTLTDGEQGRDKSKAKGEN